VIGWTIAAVTGVLLGALVVLAVGWFSSRAAPPGGLTASLRLKMWIAALGPDAELWAVWLGVGILLLVGVVWLVRRRRRSAVRPIGGDRPGIARTPRPTLAAGPAPRQPGPMMRQPGPVMPAPPPSATSPGPRPIPPAQRTTLPPSAPAGQPTRTPPPGAPGPEAIITPDASDALATPDIASRDLLRSAEASAAPRFIPPSGGLVSDAREWDEGDLIADRYEVDHKIVSGMGVVYLCRDRDANEPIAIKTYRALSDVSRSPEVVGGRQPDWQQRESVLARMFASEALIWIRLQRHPNVVEARYVAELGGKPHLFLERVGGQDGRGRTLRRLIQKGPLAPPLAMRLVLQICAGMQFATGVFPGLVHRDLKPENLLLASDEVVKITDFGLTRVFANIGGRLAALAGTPAYMSPEQCLGLTSLDSRSDIYAVGVILSELVAGKRPFQGDYLQAHLSDVPTDPRQHVADVPAELVAIIERCLKKRPEERYASFADLRDVLSDCYMAVTGEYPVLPILSDAQPDPRVRAGIDLAQAISLATLGRHDEAIGLLDRAVAADPTYAEAWRWRGVGLSALGRLNQALDCFESAVRLDPRHVDAHLEWGRLLVRLGRRNEALGRFESALAIDPLHVEARFERGTTLFFLGQHADAARDLRFAYDEQPGPALQAALKACEHATGSGPQPVLARDGLAPLTSGVDSAIGSLPHLISDVPVGSSEREPQVEGTG
jgi:tetratricopeptide (TPR) repeat protein